MDKKKRRIKTQINPFIHKNRKKRNTRSHACKRENGETQKTIKQKYRISQELFLGNARIT